MGADTGHQLCAKVRPPSLRLPQKCIQLKGPPLNSLFVLSHSVLYLEIEPRVLCMLGKLNFYFLF